MWLINSFINFSHLDRFPFAHVLNIQPKMFYLNFLKTFLKLNILGKAFTKKCVFCPQAT